MSKNHDDAKVAWQAHLEAAQKHRTENFALLAKARKSEKLATQLKQSMVADLVRVSKIPRPVLGPSSSRQRYRELGHYSAELIPFLFGNHSEYQRAAGLRDLRGTARVQNKAALLHTHQQVAAYAEREIKPWVGAFDRTARRSHLEVVVGSDFHSQFVSRFALRVFLDYLRWAQPDVVVLNGDLVDFPSISRHRQLPGHFHWNLQDEIDFARKEILAPARLACPKATILFVIGNHEYRLVNYLADTAPALASLRSLRFDDLFGLKELEIGLVCRSNFLAPYASQRAQELAENWHVIGDHYVVTHGTSISRIASAEQLKRFQKSGTSGHTHRPQVFCDNALGTGPLSWMSTPMMASHAVGRDYVPSPSQWQAGFGRAVIHRGAVSQGLVIVHPTWAEASGRVWEATKAEIAADKKLGQV
jgi:predicted phosphodiesterase